MRLGGYDLEFLLGFLARNRKQHIHLIGGPLHTWGRTHAKRNGTCLAGSKRVSGSKKVSAGCSRHRDDKLRIEKRCECCDVNKKTCLGEGDCGDRRAGGKKLCNELTKIVVQTIQWARQVDCANDMKG